MAHSKMDESSQHSLGFTTKAALVKLRNDIDNVIKEHEMKNPIG